MPQQFLLWIICFPAFCCYCYCCCCFSFFFFFFFFCFHLMKIAALSFIIAYLYTCNDGLASFFRHSAISLCLPDCQTRSPEDTGSWFQNRYVLEVNPAQQRTFQAQASTCPLKGEPTTYHSLHQLLILKVEFWMSSVQVWVRVNRCNVRCNAVVFHRISYIWTTCTRRYETISYPCHESVA